MKAQSRPEVAAAALTVRPESWSGQVEEVLQYHQLSSLDPDRRAAMPDELEWRHQPVPFRRYEGVPRVLLPHTDDAGSVDQVALAEDAGQPPAGEPPPVECVARLLERSLALGGWKRSGQAAFGLRLTPSAGNLHPLESYVLAPAFEPHGEESRPSEEGAALYHYSPFDHALEHRRWLPGPVWSSLRAACPQAHLFFGMSLIYWRCAWKYGERAFRLSHLDVGHAVAALDAAAALEGYRVHYVDAAGADLRRLLGLVEPIRQEAEDAVCLLALEPGGQGASWGHWDPQVEARKTLVASPPEGSPSGLDSPHRFWPGILSVARASHRRRDALGGASAKIQESGTPSWGDDVLRGRRSRSHFEDRTVSKTVLGRLLDSLVGRGASSAFPWRGDLAVLLFVHRVDGLESGLLAALPTAWPEARLRQSLGRDFQWRQEVTDWPGWCLWRLASGDARRAATHLAGGQSAAGDSAFTALFLARFQPLMEEQVGFAYRRVHWQAGELGHGLYLAAEDEGLGATGLAGFFDGQLCTVLGLQDDSWRPVYMTAVGHRRGVEPALQPPYAHRLRGAIPLPASAGGMGFNDAP